MTNYFNEGGKQSNKFLVMNKIFDNIHIIIPYAWLPRLTESTTFLQVQSVFTHVATIYANLMNNKKGVYLRKEFNPHRISLEHQHGHQFIVLEHQYGRHDVMWKRSILF